MTNGTTVSETAARLGASHAAIESQFERLAADGLIRDSGERRNGEIVWLTNEAGKRAVRGDLQ
jgi:hypothetical protein